MNLFEWYVNTAKFLWAIDEYKLFVIADVLGVIACSMIILVIALGFLLGFVQDVKEAREGIND